MIMLNTWLQTLIQKDASKAMVYPYHGDENCVHLSLMVAINLNSLIDPESEGPLLKRIQIIRKQILFETGINIKGVRVCDADIPNNSYLIMYDKETLAEGVIEPNASLGFSNNSEKSGLDFKIMDHPFLDRKMQWVRHSELDSQEFSDPDLCSAIDLISFHFHVVSKQVVCFDLICKEYQITDREKELIKQCLEGKSNLEISTKLFISESTVKQHLQNIFDKMNINNRFELIQQFSST